MTTNRERFMNPPYRAIAVKLAAFCCRLHCREEDVPSDERSEAIKLAHEFIRVDRDEREKSAVLSKSNQSKGATP